LIAKEEIVAYVHHAQNAFLEPTSAK